MNECESWTIKKAEHPKIDAFKLWCWRRLLRVPWTARRSNQSILKEINPEYSLEGQMLNLQYFGHLMQRADSGKDPYMGKDWEQEEKGMAEDKMVGCHHWLTRQEFQQTLGDSEGQGSLACCSPWVCSVRHNIATGQQQQQNAFLFSSFYFYELCVYTLLSWIHFMIAGDFHLCFIVSPGLVTDVFQNISFLYKAHVCLSPPQ